MIIVKYQSIIITDNILLFKWLEIRIKSLIKFIDNTNLVSRSIQKIKIVYTNWKLISTNITNKYKNIVKFSDNYLTTINFSDIIAKYNIKERLYNVQHGG